MISPYILIHLMCSVILMAIALFLLDLVRIAFLMNLTYIGIEPNSNINFSSNFSNFNQ